jgi:Spy/CpxP family protein refolding chaperone
MKKWMFLALLLANSLTGYGQREMRVDREKLQAARVAFVTNRLSLSPEQAEKFWPLYNEHEDNRKELMRELYRISKKAKEESLSESAARALIDERFDLQKALLEQEKEFLYKVSETLSPQQALRLNETNRDFARHIYRMQGREREKGREEGPEN